MFGNWLLTLAISAVVMLVLFRRARRLFGRQKYSLPRLVFRVGPFGAVCLLLIVLLSLARGAAPWIGLAFGIAVGCFGFYLTRFETLDGELYFKPNAYIGAAVLSLFLGRAIYRVSGIGAVLGNGEPGAASMSSAQNSPLTAAILFTVLGFYVCYYLAVLIRGRSLLKAAPEPPI